MDNIISSIGTANISVPAARLSILASAGALIFLGSLHMLCPEFDPSWRMVSEYALGRYSVALSLMFISWAIGTWALAFAIRNQVTTRWGKIGLGFLVASGGGEFSAAFFDITHPLHGLTAMIGGPSLPIAAMIISVHLGRTQPWGYARKKLLLAANLTWIAVVLFAITMIIFFTTYSQAGGDLSGEPVSTLPDGVIAINGWANRLWVITYCVWTITTALESIQIQNTNRQSEPKSY